MRTIDPGLIEVEEVNVIEGTVEIILTIFSIFCVFVIMILDDIGHSIRDHTMSRLKLRKRIHEILRSR